MTNKEEIENLKELNKVWAETMIKGMEQARESGFQEGSNSKLAEIKEKIEDIYKDSILDLSCNQCKKVSIKLKKLLSQIDEVKR